MRQGIPPTTPATWYLPVIHMARLTRDSSVPDVDDESKRATLTFQIR